MSNIKTTEIASIGDVKVAGNYLAKWSSITVLIWNGAAFIDRGVKTDIGVKGTVNCLLKVNIDLTAEIAY